MECGFQNLTLSQLNVLACITAYTWYGVLSTLILVSMVRPWRWILVEMCGINVSTARTRKCKTKTPACRALSCTFVQYRVLLCITMHDYVMLYIIIHFHQLSCTTVHYRALPRITMHDRALSCNSVCDHALPSLSIMYCNVFVYSMIMHGLCMVCVWIRHALCMDYAWIINRFWTMHDLCMDYAWIMYRLCVNCSAIPHG